MWVYTLYYTKVFSQIRNLRKAKIRRKSWSVRLFWSGGFSFFFYWPGAQIELIPCLWRRFGSSKVVLPLCHWEVHLSPRLTMNHSSLPVISWLYFSINVLRLWVLWGAQDSAGLTTGPCWSKQKTQQWRLFSKWITEEHKQKWKKGAGN